MTGRRPTTAIRQAVAATPLRIKLLGAVLLLATIGMTIAATVTTTALHGYLLGRVDDQLRTFSHGPGGGDDFDYRGGPPPSGPAPGDSGHRQLPSQFYVERFTAAGQYAGTSEVLLNTQSPPKLPALTSQKAASLSQHAFTVPSVDGESSWRVVTVVNPDGSFAAVATSLSDIDHTVNHVVVLELAIGLGALTLIGLAGYLLIDRSLRPLVAVEHTAAAIAAGDLAQRVPDLPERTEVGRLSVALNGMLAQIERAFSGERASREQARESEGRMRQFVADASHELRTPLTSIRGFAELYRIGAAAEQPDVAHLMRRIEDEATRMGLLVDDLLLLARLDQQRPVAREPVDLLTVVADVVHDAKAVAAERAITLQVDTSSPAIVNGDEPRLRQVLHNLLTNALAHTPPGTPVDVSVTTAAGTHPTVAIRVADRGPGIPAALRGQVFERFYRADAARTSGGGAGLGLAIVAGLVAAHDGDVTVADREGGGTTFTVTLPLASEPATAT
jgi:two-component system OmpR family sensor kinase